MCIFLDHSGYFPFECRSENIYMSFGRHLKAIPHLAFQNRNRIAITSKQIKGSFMNNN